MECLWERHRWTLNLVWHMQARRRTDGLFLKHRRGKSELWKTSFNDPLTCDSYAQASKTSEPQCHIAALKRVLSL